MKKSLTAALIFVIFASIIFVLPADAAKKASKTSNKKYKVSGRTITPVVKKKKDITTNVNEALKEANKRASSSKIYTVKIPKGTYYISKSLKIRSNTKLVATGCTIKAKKGSFNIICTGTAAENKKAKGYGAYRNITIQGGKWINTKSNTNTGIRLCRGTNITVKNIEMSGGSEKHMIEMAAVDKVKITGCYFHDSDVRNAKAKCEAVQMDVCTNDNAFKGIVYDGTPCKNITIDKNTFKNLSRGVGSHSLLLNSYIDNVRITNNTFENISQECITCVNYVNSVISGNNIKSAGGGILFHYSKTSSNSIYARIGNGKTAFSSAKITNANSVIENNTVRTVYNPLCDKNVGIELYGRNFTSNEKSADGGTIPAGDYYVSGVTVQNNKVTSSGYGIVLSDAKQNRVIGNTVKGEGYSSADPNVKSESYDGIFLNFASTDNTVDRNNISNSLRNGIFLNRSSSAVTINSNTVTGCRNYGIRLYDNSKVTGSIKDNKISGCGTNTVGGIKSASIDEEEEISEDMDIDEEEISEDIDIDEEP